MSLGSKIFLYNTCMISYNMRAMEPAVCRFDFFFFLIIYLRFHQQLQMINHSSVCKCVLGARSLLLQIDLN